MRVRVPPPIPLLENEMSNWKPFWFESNSCWGKVDSPEKWEEMKRKYKEISGNELDPSKARMGTYGLPEAQWSDNMKQNFGFRSEHVGGTTLVDFANEHGFKV